MEMNERSILKIEVVSACFMNHFNLCKKVFSVAQIDESSFHKFSLNLSDPVETFTRCVLVKKIKEDIGESENTTINTISFNPGYTPKTYLLFLK